MTLNPGLSSEGAVGGCSGVTGLDCKIQNRLYTRNGQKDTGNNTWYPVRLALVSHYREYSDR